MARAPEPFAQLVALLARLEEARPYVTVEDVCAAWKPSTEVEACRGLIAEAIGDWRLFSDARDRYDPVSGGYQPVRVIRLNRRHAAIAALLD
jgi:hypothetical protein